MNNSGEADLPQADLADITHTRLMQVSSDSLRGGEVRSIRNSDSGHEFMSHGPDVNSGRSNKKRVLSSSRRSGSSLEPVAEELSWDHPDPNFKLSRLSENDLLVETGGATKSPTN